MKNRPDVVLDRVAAPPCCPSRHHPYRPPYHHHAPRNPLKLLQSSNALMMGVTAFVLMATSPLHAQSDDWEGIMFPGQMVVTGFSGTAIPGGPVPDGVDEIDETFIDLNRASARIMDVSYPAAPPTGQLIDSPAMREFLARDVGQVFGIALDDNRYANIYLTASSAFGLQIVSDDADADGRPERETTGGAGRRWMDGQWGNADAGGGPDGGPGSVWKIDGRTGEVSLFATIRRDGVNNTGAGLGNIAFDSRRGQFYVSDRDTGLIHRLDRNGNDLGTFDHGVIAREAAGLGAFPFDPANRLDISDPAFDAEDSSTWALADARRRVWGVAVHGGRLYYAVAGGPQIWSVGINRDGSFGDSRWEVDVPPAPKPFEISDIAFDPQGRMILAQRGTEQGDYAYKEFAAQGEARVLRFVLETPDDPATDSRWVPAPDEYAIGFRATLQNTNGGVTSNYGYTREHYINAAGTADYLWTTGEQLRNPEEEPTREALADGGPFAVNGLQGNTLSLVRDLNVPPFQSYLTDFDDSFEDDDTFGHMGDVEALVTSDGAYRPPLDFGGGTPVPPGQDVCLSLARRWSCDIGPDGRRYKLTIGDSSGFGFDSVQTTTPTPGFSVVPRRQPLGDGRVDVSIDGLLGEPFVLDVCTFRGADAAAGGSFACCKARIADILPEIHCEGPGGEILDDAELDALLGAEGGE
jgi:hypothetical protein